MDPGPVPTPPRKLDRYAIFDEIASGGMATVHLGRFLGSVGFTRTVAIKRMHTHLATEQDFVTMFLDEARLAARIRHPNVVSILDVVSVPGELALVMELVQGEALDRLLRALRDRKERMPPHIATSIAAGMLHGLHAAHEAKSERGEPLEIVHRDVSPQNVLVGIDGGVRVVDFGIAKAQGRLGTTREGQLKGKLMYMSPEQALHEDVDRRTDVFAVGIVLWEMLVGKRLFEGIHEAAILSKVLGKEVQPPSTLDPSLVRFDRVVMKALARDPADRYPSARAMVVELERVWALATPTDIGAWVERLAGATIARRTELMLAIERMPLEQLPAASIPAPEPGSIPPPAPAGAHTVVEGRRADAQGFGPREISRVASATSDVSAISAPIAGAAETGSSWQGAPSEASYRDDGARLRSQVSTISVSRSHPVAASAMSGRTRIWIATVGASMFAGALLAVALFAGSRGPTAPAATSAPQASAATSDPSATATPAEPPTAAPPATVVDEEALSPRAPATSSAAAGPAKPRPAARPPGTGAPRATSTSSVQKPTDYGF